MDGNTKNIQFFAQSFFLKPGNTEKSVSEKT